MALTSRIDPRAIRAALSDPQAVARALGLEKGARRGGGGIAVRCPVHRERSAPSMSLRSCGDGTLSAVCHQCGWRGDVLSLVAAVEGLDVRRDFGRVLERAAELAGGFVRATVQENAMVRPEAPRLPEAVAAELFARVCKARLLRQRGAVEAYLDRRGLLEAARDDGWATLPSLDEMLDVARGMCEESGACVRPIGSDGEQRHPEQSLTVCPRLVRQPADTSSKASGQVSGAFAFGGPEELLIAARLARRDRDGRLRVVWGRHRLVIPWRGPDGRIQALQRRLIDKPRIWHGQEEPRYVLPWAPRWPYGVENLSQREHAPEAPGCSAAQTLVPGPRLARTEPFVGVRVVADALAHEEAVQLALHEAQHSLPVVFVEGGVDALAMRLLRPGRCVSLGLPGTGAWESSWAGLVGQRKVYFGTDGDASGDARAAKAAIDVAEVKGLKPEAARRARTILDDRLRALATIKRDEEQGRITGDVAAERRAALGPARCVLCGVEAELLCRGCGRVRARGKDWGEMWLARARGTR